ncbi:subunit 2 of molecular cheperone prefoldin [Chloropicon roscoffensis]|uniref:Subunit 2 of molecular cheperone prefoldin n=1 Tax=Chloropicon roscoffensis TaxID=1461544 RepID=A0AAX4PHY4_9CHLO
MANEPKNENEVVQRFTSMRQEVQTLYQKLSELDAELQEHELVIKAISDMEEKRKCFRLVGGVLVERTVGEVLPAVNTNKQGIASIKEQLQKQFDSKKEELKAFQDKWKITVKNDNSQQNEAETSSGDNKGILA